MKTFLIFFSCILIVLFIFAQIYSYFRDQEDAPYGTYLRLLEISSKGCEEYRDHYHKWPMSLEQIVNFNYALRENTNDAWDNNVTFVPYDDKLGYGELISYGRDNKPGGAGKDRDLIVRFPINSNYAWNKQVARGVRGANFKNYDWFDGCVLGMYWPQTNQLMTNVDWGKP